MHQDQLYNRLVYLEEQKSSIEKEIISIKYEIDKQSPLSKVDKIALFRKLFIGNELAYAKHWISKDGLKKGYAPATKTFRGSDYISVILSTSSYIGEGIEIGHLDTIVFTMPISYPERIIQYLKIVSIKE